VTAIFKKAFYLKGSNPLTREMEIEMSKTKNMINNDFRFINVEMGTYSVEKGISKFSKLLEKYKCFSLVYISLGNYYSQNNELDKAKEYLDKAFLLDPYNPGYYNNYAMVLDKLGNRNEAIRLLKKAIELNPNEKMYKRNLDAMNEDFVRIQYMFLLMNKKFTNEKEIVLEIMNMFKDVMGENVNVLTIIVNNDDILKLEIDIGIYGNNLHSNDLLQHQFAWALLTRFSREKNIDLKKRNLQLFCIKIRGDTFIVFTIS